MNIHHVLTSLSLQDETKTTVWIYLRFSQFSSQQFNVKYSKEPTLDRQKAPPRRPNLSYLFLLISPHLFHSNQPIHEQYPIRIILTSHRPSPQQNHPHRLHQNLHIQPQTPPHNILPIQPHHFLKVRNIAPPAHLPHPGDPRLGRQPHPMP